ncbi:hypothetical protein AVEN_267644-1 [Araneus ventricosus]|uniref:Secreted protein n=1 Tax=Araneus ventricosus TaxID=182803 RepID=A0A4Y2PHQ2_ARAVE|nr:hypothetical protein AVEN_267644-1 [Araneus ventricosus]
MSCRSPGFHHSTCLVVGLHVTTAHVSSLAYMSPQHMSRRWLACHHSTCLVVGLHVTTTHVSSFACMSPQHMSRRSLRIRYFFGCQSSVSSFDSKTSSVFEN